ncbi:MAG: CoA transferase [Dehalococcoidales bacterium]|nr:CoA transferase [Dehalococcoidales bacterium]
MQETSLGPYRVLDLTDENGQLGARILADLGADTIVIEPPGGSHTRRLGPFYHNIPHPEKSLFWFALNSNKRGITLDLETADGRDILKRLVATADFLFESYPPGYMEKLGLDYAVLKEVNPGLVMTSITPFGQTGPWRDYKGSDLVEMSLGGLVFLSGEPGEQPLRVPVPQIYFHAGSWAASGAMMAFTGRHFSGEGQHVDVSMLEASAWSNYSAAEWWSYSNLLLKREGTWRQQGLSRMRLIFDCKDGYVLMFLLGGTMATVGEYKMVEWMEAEGKCPDWLKGFDWEKLDVANVEQKFFDDLSDAVAPFLLDKTKKQLFDWATENELFLAPVSDTEDLLENPQLKSREFWVRLEHPELEDSITYPGPFVKMSETPVTVRHRAPLIGEHNIEIYRDELGISASELITLKQAGVI